MNGKENNHPGSLVLSLDFEMMWGVIDMSTAEEYGKTNVSQVREVIFRMLDLFKKYDVNVTFATVGMLMLDDVQKVKETLPSLRPTYEKETLSPYANGYLDHIKVKDKDLYFAPDLIASLQTADNVEIGTHTFCHYYCNAKGQTESQFEADLKTAIEVAFFMGVRLRSIVFPRNQVAESYLAVCARHGIECYRGNAMRFFGAHNKLQWFMNKIGRFLDSYFRVGARASYPYTAIDLDVSPVNIRASRFFRPFNRRLAVLEPLRIRRIKREIEYAAKHNEVYHLWWHPHNFGKDLEKNLYNLEVILKCFDHCRELYGMQSYTMSGLLDALR